PRAHERGPARPPRGPLACGMRTRTREGHRERMRVASWEGLSEEARLRCQGEAVGEVGSNDSQTSFGPLGHRVDHLDRSNVAAAERARAQNEKALISEKLRQSGRLEVALRLRRDGLELCHFDRGALPRIRQ